MPILKTQSEVAKYFGVTATAVRKWEDNPAFPNRTEFGYDTDAIAEFRVVHLKGPQSTPQTEQAQQLGLALKAIKLQREKLALEQEEEERRRARGDILSRSELETAITEIITVARDRLLSVSGRIARLVPRKFQARVKAEIEKLIRAVLDDMSSMFEQLDEDDADEPNS